MRLLCKNECRIEDNLYICMRFYWHKGNHQSAAVAGLNYGYFEWENLDKVDEVLRVLDGNRTIKRWRVYVDGVIREARESLYTGGTRV